MAEILFLDTEFTGLHQNTQLISLALYKDEEAYFYAEFNDYDTAQLTDWHNQQVIKNLKYNDHPSFKEIKNLQVNIKGNREIIITELKQWLSKFALIEIWADVLAYDWVLFCELFGGALKTPDNIFYTPFDLATLFRKAGLIEPRDKYAKDVVRFDFEGADKNKQHNALDDARVSKFWFEKIFIHKMSNNMESETLRTRLKNYRVDFAIAKGTYFAASHRLKKKFESKERRGQGLSILATVLSIAVLTVLQFYLAEKLGNIAIYIVTALAFVSVIISIYLFFHKNPEQYIAYHNRAEEYLLLYKQAKNAEARFADNLLTPDQLSQEVDKLYNAQARLVAVPLVETTDEDYEASKKGIADGQCKYTEDDFKNT